MVDLMVVSGVDGLGPFAKQISALQESSSGMLELPHKRATHVFRAMQTI